MNPDAGRLAARDVLLAMLVRPRTAVYGMRQIMEAWAAAGGSKASCIVMLACIELSWHQTSSRTTCV
jgi:hypothetical protein